MVVLIDFDLSRPVRCNLKDVHLLANDDDGTIFANPIDLKDANQ